MGYLQELSHTLVFDKREPFEIIEVLRETKSHKVNETSLSVREQLFSITFDPRKETVHECNTKFQEAVHKYEIVFKN